MLPFWVHFSSIFSVGKGFSSIPSSSPSGSSFQMALPAQANQTLKSPVTVAAVEVLNRSLLATNSSAWNTRQTVARSRQ